VIIADIVTVSVASGVERGEVEGHDANLPGLRITYRIPGIIFPEVDFRGHYN
jgi:hypothetical protein